MGMWDRIFEPSVTGSEMWSCTWSNKRVKSCYCARAGLSTDQGSLWRGQPVTESYPSKFLCEPPAAVLCVMTSDRRRRIFSLGVRPRALAKNLINEKAATASSAAGARRLINYHIHHPWRLLAPHPRLSEEVAAEEVAAETSRAVQAAHCALQRCV